MLTPRVTYTELYTNMYFYSELAGGGSYTYVQRVAKVKRGSSLYNYEVKKTRVKTVFKQFTPLDH